MLSTTLLVARSMYPQIGHKPPAPEAANVPAHPGDSSLVPTTAPFAESYDLLPSQSNPVADQIVPSAALAATVTTIDSNLNPSTVGENVTFTSTVSTATGLGTAPTGAVTFKDGTASFATVLVAPKDTQNVAQTTISNLAVGTHSITAIYSGDAATLASVSKVLVQQVNYPLTMAPPGYTITVTPASVSVAAGATADLTVTVTPLSGFVGAVALSCSNLPKESACTFGHSTIPIGGGTTTLALTTLSPHDCNSDVPYGGFGSLHPPASIFHRTLRYGAPILAGTLLLLLPRRRRFVSALLSKSLLAIIGVFTLAALANLVGCGNRCTDFGTAPGHYTLKVNGMGPVATPVATGGTPAEGANALTVATSVALTVKL